MDVFEYYFGECTETSLKDNYVIVYEVRLVQSNEFRNTHILVTGWNAGFRIAVGNWNEYFGRVDQTTKYYSQDDKTYYRRWYKVRHMIQM